MIYLDNAATTAIKQEVLDVMMPYFKGEYGNPSSISSLGISANKAIMNAKEVIAETINANPDEIFFTSGGTESNNWVLRGYCDMIYRLFDDLLPIIYISPIEHPSVYKTCRFLENSIHNAFIREFIVGYDHEIDIDATITRYGNEHNVIPLISVMLGNNETGSIQDLSIIQNKYKHKIIHTDAVQCYGQIPIDISRVDLLSASGHKLGAPKGIGFLYISRQIQNIYPPFIYGGHQQDGYRAGTENVPYIVGLAKAAELAHKHMNWKIRHISNLKSTFIDGLKDLDCMILTPKHSLPGIVTVSFPYCEGEVVVLTLDTYDICTSAGSACSINTEDKSRTLLKLGYEKDVAYSSVRFSFGENNTIAEVEQVLNILHQIIPRLQQSV